MGVHGLWNLLEPSGKAVPLETLENKVLAVDVSIWLHQLVKGFQDSRGNPLPNAHLLGLFHRICKLLFFKIKPVFVFDGDVPLLKKKTVAARQRQRGKLQDDATEMRQKLAKNILKQVAVKEALGPEKADQQLNLNIPRSRQEPDIFELPPLKPRELPESSEIDYMSSSEEDKDADSDFEECSTHMHADLHSIDVNSEDFKALPADVRHDILTDLKETRKQSSWGRMHEMPEDSGQFSNFQMNRLLKRRNFQVSLEEAEKEMGGRTLTLGELEELLNDNGVMTDTNLDLGKRIASDSTSRYVYIREAAKKTLFSPASTKPPIKDAKAKDPCQTPNKSIDQPGPSKAVFEQVIAEEEDKFEDDWISDTEYDAQVDSQVGSALKDSNSRVDLARDFMFVASDLTQEQIDKILSKRNSSPQKKTRQQPDVSSIVEEFSAPGSSKYFSPVSQPTEELDYIGIISDESESDSEDVPHSDAVSAKPIEVVVQPDKEYNIEEDMFADIFFNIEHAMLRHQKQTSDGSKVLHRSEDGRSTGSTKHHSSIAANGRIEGSNRELAKVVDQEVVEVENDDKNETLLNSEYKKESPIMSVEAADDASSTSKCANPSLEKMHDTKTPVQLDASTQPAEEVSDTGIEIHEVKLVEEDAKNVVSIGNSPKADILECQSISSPNQTNLQSSLEVIESKEIAAAKISPANNEVLSSTENKPEEISKTNLESANESPDDSDIECDIDEESPGIVASETSLGEKPEQSLDENVTREVLPSQPTASTSKLSTVELQGMQATLANQHESLLTEKGKADRMAASITSQMSTEAQELLRLFGLPYIVAPMEAEAQCAFLDAVSLTDGTISDDSDIWLFGGRKVYKNFFNQKKHVMQFTSGDIQQVLKLPRNQMILLALLTGSDYTVGLSGVGPVTALEILAAFPSGRVEDERFVARDLSYGLKKFREWFMNGRPVGPGTAKLRNKLKDLELNEGFPSLAVIEAYLKPTIDESKERFTWGKPDLARLQEYARVKFGWTKMKTDEILIPVLNKLNERHKQMSLDGYLHVKLPSTDGKLSKRVQQAVHRLAAESTTSDAEDDPQPQKRKNESSKNSTERGQSIPKKRSKGESAKGARKETKETGPSTSNEFIPQREKDRLNALQSKIKAIELFRMSKLEGKKTKSKRPVRLEKIEAELSESDSD